MMRVVIGLLLAFISTVALAGGHGNALTPYTVGFDGWTVLGPTAPGSQPNCGTGTPNTTPQCWFYVSSTGADGANVCTNPASPCATIAHATAQLRVGKPDHLNILCGDTIPFVATRVMTLQNIGQSATAPAVVTTYCPSTAPANTSGTNLPEGSGPRPTLQADCTNGGIGIFGVTGNYIAIINLRLYNYQRDPLNSGSYNPACNGNGGSGLFNSNAMLNWILIEGSTFEYFQGIGFTTDIAPHTGFNWFLRRSLVYNSYGGNGIFFEGQTGTILFEESTICNTGWNADATTAINSASYNSGTGVVTMTIAANVGYTAAGQRVVISGMTGTGANLVNGTQTTAAGTGNTTLTIQISTGQTISGLTGGNVVGIPDTASHHNFYNAYGPDSVSPPYPNGTTLVPTTQGNISAPLILKGNIICRGINNDQLRAGGEAQFNAWIANPGALSIGGPIANITDNIIVEAQNYYISNNGYGSGFTTGTQNIPQFTTIPTRGPNGKLNVARNIFTTNSGTASNAAIISQTKVCNASIQGCTNPTTNYLYDSNIFCGWAAGGIAKNSDGAVLTLNSTFTAGGGGAPGTYPLTALTGGAGSGAVASVTVGAGGGVTSVNITQFGGIGALFTLQLSGTTTAIITGTQAGGFILPNGTGYNSPLLDGNGNGIGGRTITAQIDGTPNGDGHYTVSAAGTFGPAAASSYMADSSSGIIGPRTGTGYTAGDTLGITAGSGIGQIPGLSGFSINVATVATNTYTNNTTDGTVACSTLSGPNPSITVGSYNASIGGTATTASYLTSVLAKSKTDANGNPNWPYKYSAYALVNAFKTGFGQTPNAPVYSP